MLDAVSHRRDPHETPNRSRIRSSSKARYESRRNNAWLTFALLSFEYLAVSLLFIWVTLVYVAFVYFPFRHLGWCENDVSEATRQEYSNDPDTEMNKASAMIGLIRERLLLIGENCRVLFVSESGYAHSLLGGDIT